MIGFNEACRHDTTVLETQILRLQNGTFRYQLVLNGIRVLCSTRTFLTKDECTIERDWVIDKLGWTHVNR